jgi:hypothetical protein
MQLGFSVSNSQEIQLNTDLLKRRSQVFIHNANASLKINKIKAIKVWLKSGIKLGEILIYKLLEKSSSREFLDLSPNIVGLLKILTMQAYILLLQIDNVICIKLRTVNWGLIFSRVRNFCEWAVSDLDP